MFPPIVPSSDPKMYSGNVGKNNKVATNTPKKNAITAQNNVA